MNILPINKIKLGMRLGQNIYRHDGLLALPKGSIILKQELDTIKYFTLDFVLVTSREHAISKKDDLNFSLNVLEAAYKKSSLWNSSFGEKLYDELEKRIVKNKKLKKYLNILRDFDSYSYAHCINISMVVASLLKKDDEVDEGLVDIVLLTLFHDIGRVKMDKIFHKDGKLTNEEFLQLTKHPYISFKMLKKAGFSEYNLKFLLETHERWDGGGYPQKLKEEEIADLAQIIFISDVYNALSSYRPYRGIYAPYSVIKIIDNERDKMFGGRYINLFLERFSPYKKGTVVELNNGKTAIVKKTKEDKKLLPIVEIISEDNTGADFVDLTKNKEIRIRKIIKSN